MANLQAMVNLESVNMDWERELDTWTEQYEPIKNHFSQPQGEFADEFIEDKFETYGEELEYVLAINETEPNRVWTLIEGDSGNLYISSGFHYVTRLNYFITAKSFEGEFLEVPYYIYDNSELDLEILQEEDHGDERINTWYLFDHNQNEVFRNQWFNTEAEAQDYLDTVEEEVTA
jgi:hypothetical protein